MGSPSTKTKPLWQPNPGRQARFVATAVDEVLWGGEAGGGKSAAILAMLLRWVLAETFNALILRREASDLGKLLREAHRLYPRCGGVWRASESTYVWPSGARVRFSHCQREADAYAYQGDEFNVVSFDELTHFTRTQYLEISSRLRTTDPTLPALLRATSNPGGPGHEWVFERFGPWLNPLCELPDRAPRFDAQGRRLPPAREGEVLWFAPTDEQGGEQVVPEGTPLAQSRTMLRSVRAECRQIAPGYEARLARLDPVRRAQLKGGNWLAKPAPKDYWDRALVQVLRVAPARHEVAARVRWWDFASSPDGDYSAGARCSYLHSGLFVVEHVAHFKGGPDRLYARFGAHGEADRLFDPNCGQGIPEDPGAAGKIAAADFLREFPRLSIKTRRPGGEKSTRFRPVSSRALSGRVAVVDDGSWDVSGLHDELEALWSGAHDDRADALSDAYAEVASDEPADFAGEDPVLVYRE